MACAVQAVGKNTKRATRVCVGSLAGFKWTIQVSDTRRLRNARPEMIERICRQ